MINSDFMIDSPIPHSLSAVFENVGYCILLNGLCDVLQVPLKIAVILGVNVDHGLAHPSIGNYLFIHVLNFARVKRE